MTLHKRLVKVDATDPKQVAQARAIIRLLYNVNSRAYVRKNVRFRELETVFAYCWRGTHLTGRDCLYIAACHIWHMARKCGADAAIEEWARLWAPWCGPAELAALIERVAANPQTWTADELADELGYILPFSVRQALGLTTIGSFDVDKRGREQRRERTTRTTAPSGGDGTVQSRGQNGSPRTPQVATSLG